MPLWRAGLIGEGLRWLVQVKAREAKVTLGVDIGSSAVKVVALGPRRGVGGERPVIGHHVVPLQEEKGADASSAVRVALETMHMAVRAINLSVSGQWVVMRAVEMPSLTPDEMRKALPFEAQRYLPFKLQEVIVDGVVLGPADTNRSWVLIVACKRELIDRRLEWAKGAGLEVAVIDVDALALTNAFLATADGRKMEGTRALINVGTQMTNLAVFQRDIPYLVRDIPWGAEKLARHAAEQMGTDPAAVRKQLSQGEASAEFASAIAVNAETLVTELQLSFDYFENRFGQPPEEVLISGGLSQSPAFAAALKAKLAQTITPWSPVKGLSGQFAVAYGLALRTD